MSCSKILLVEDDPFVAKMCGSILANSGYEYLTASDGCEGIDVYKSRHDEITLVLSDVGLPNKTGVEMARELFASNPNLSVILMSGGDCADIIPPDVEKLCAIVQKPFTAPQLLGVIKKCLACRHKAPQKRRKISAVRRNKYLPRTTSEADTL